MNRIRLSPLGAWVLALVAALPGQAEVVSYDITTIWYEPYCSLNSIFVGSFDYDAGTHAVTNLKGKLSEAMEGGSYNAVTGPSPTDGIAWLSLNNQLTNGDASHTYSWHDVALGGTFATVFKNADFLTFSGGDGWSPQAGVDAWGAYAGSPNPDDNPQNAYALVFVPDNLTSANTTSNPISLAWDETAGTGSPGLARTAYADCTEFGLMTTIGMTGTSALAYRAIGTMGGVPLSEVITTSLPEPATWRVLCTAIASTALVLRGRGRKPIA